MRTITINVYQYTELDDKAKQKAREWWIPIESEDPAWYDDHCKSLRAAIRAVTRLVDSDNVTTETIAQLKQKADKAELTGYVDDCILGDLLEGDKLPTEEDIKNAFASAWDKELRERYSDEYIVDAMTANKWEFTADGTFYKGD